MGLAFRVVRPYRLSPTQIISCRPTGYAIFFTVEESESPAVPKSTVKEIGGHHLISRGAGILGWTKILFQFNPAYESSLFFPAVGLWLTNYNIYFNHFWKDVHKLPLYFWVYII